MIPSKNEVISVLKKYPTCCPNNKISFEGSPVPVCKMHSEILGLTKEILSLDEKWSIGCPSTWLNKTEIKKRIKEV